MNNLILYVKFTYSNKLVLIYDFIRLCTLLLLIALLFVDISSFRSQFVVVSSLFIVSNFFNILIYQAKAKNTFFLNQVLRFDIKAIFSYALISHLVFIAIAELFVILCFSNNIYDTSVGSIIILGTLFSSNIIQTIFYTFFSRNTHRNEVRSLADLPPHNFKLAIKGVLFSVVGFCVMFLSLYDGFISYNVYFQLSYVILSIFHMLNSIRYCLMVQNESELII